MLDLCQAVVVTRGAAGSVILTREGEVRVPVAPARALVDPTGAGDAYTAGLVASLLRGHPLPLAGRLAALAAVYAVESYGTQNHYYTLEEFADRFRSAFPGYDTAGTSVEAGPLVHLAR
jgi:adenosine kinase